MSYKSYNRTYLPQHKIIWNVIPKFNFFSRIDLKSYPNTYWMFFIVVIRMMRASNTTEDTDYVLRCLIEPIKMFHIQPENSFRPSVSDGILKYLSILAKHEQFHLWEVVLRRPDLYFHFNLQSKASTEKSKKNERNKTSSFEVLNF